MIQGFREELDFELPCVGHGRRIFDCYKYGERRDEMKTSFTYQVEMEA